MSKDKPPTAKTPQEKKALSYVRDRRNDYGESNKGSRKTIPARKAVEHRTSRHRAAQDIKTVVTSDEATADLIESSLRHDVERIGGWTKAPDAPLGEFLHRQNRVRMGRAPKSDREDG